MTAALAPVAATGVGSMPGTSVDGGRPASSRASSRASSTWSSCPARGPGADMIGRTGGLLASVSSGMALETTPDGWRFTAGIGREMRPAPCPSSARTSTPSRSRRRATPARSSARWSARGRWRRRSSCTSGERALRDPGAAWDIAQALGEAVAGHVADLRRRLPRGVGRSSSSWTSRRCPPCSRAGSGTASGLSLVPRGRPAGGRAGARARARPRGRRGRRAPACTAARRTSR